MERTRDLERILGWDFKDLEMIFDLEGIWSGISMTWTGFAIWKGFVLGFQRFGEDFRFGKDLDGISTIWKGFAIWKGFGMGFQRFGQDSRFGKDSGRDFTDLERIFRFGKDLEWDFNDLERIRDSERIWAGISKIWKGISIWKRLEWDFNDLERIRD